MNATRALLARYDAATPQQVRRGRGWYREARRECRAIAAETGHTYRQVAAVLAVTSPEMRLAENVSRTRRACLNGGATAGRYPGQQVPKVRAILADRRRPGRHATGPKVSAFYRAIVGDHGALVIDRWAAFAAGGLKSRAPRARERAEMAAAYLAAAACAGETIAAFQAIVWIQCRESTPRADGRRNGLRDIHEIRKVAS